jgi:hypothetical protein
MPTRRTKTNDASGGFKWNLWSNGYCQGTFTTNAGGPQQVRVRALGDPAAGVWPLMEVRINGVLVGTFSVSDDVWKTYTSNVDVGVGSHVVRISFTNDEVVNGDDRNLLLDVATGWA